MHVDYDVLKGLVQNPPDELAVLSVKSLLARQDYQVHKKLSPSDDGLVEKTDAYISALEAEIRGTRQCVYRLNFSNEQQAKEIAELNKTIAVMELEKEVESIGVHGNNKK